MNNWSAVAFRNLSSKLTSQARMSLDSLLWNCPRGDAFFSILFLFSVFAVAGILKVLPPTVKGVLEYLDWVVDEKAQI